MINNTATYIRKSFLLFAMSGVFFLNATNVNFEKEKSIQELLEAQNPSVSFSFSKDILDLFDADLNWKNKKKHLEGDFSKAAFFAFDEHSSFKKINQLFNNQEYNRVKIEDEGSEDDEIIMFLSNNGKDINEAHFVVKNDDKVIIFSLYGKMRLKDKK